MLGNIRFIGELGKLAVVHEGILHKCIQQLLEKKRGLSLTDQAEDLECLCQIMRTVGKRLDTSKAKLWMDQYFERMETIKQSGEMPSRIRFMLQDVIEMRQNVWEPRRVAREMTPQTIGQIRNSMTPTRPSMDAPPPRGPSSAVNAGLVDIFGVPMTKRVGSANSLTSLSDTNTRSISPASTARAAYNRTTTEQLGKSDYYDKEMRDWDGMNDRDGAPINRDPVNRTIPNDSRDPGLRSRDQVPRLSNKTLTSMSGDKLSLRPGSALAPSFKPSSPHQLPKSARSSNLSPTPTSLSEPVRETPIFTKPPAVVIKQESRQKNKKQVQTGESKVGGRQSPKPLSENSKCDRILKATEKVWAGEDSKSGLDEVCQLFREMQLAKSAHSKLLLKMMMQAVKKRDTVEDSPSRFSNLVAELFSSDLVTSATIDTALSNHVSDIGYAELSYPEIRDWTCDLLCSMVVSDVISVSTTCKMFEGGHSHHMALRLLGKVAEVKGLDWLKEQISQEKISIIQLVPSAQQRDEDMMNLLEEYHISQLMPMLALQKQLWNQINADPNPTSLYKWINKNVENTKQDDQFTRVLFKTLLKYISRETSLEDGTDTTRLPDKAVQEQEKALFSRYQDIMLSFLHESQHQQMVALYSLQLFCHEHNFPKGMMLRSFTYLYDLEIIDDEVFLKWKEDINETYPGKGKALFEVNQWLTWLEQAESESEDDED